MSQGWKGLPEVECNGDHWPLAFAAELLDFPEPDLRELIKIVGLKPTGTIKTADYRRQGRNPRAYSASELVRLVNGIRELMIQSSTELGTAGMAGLGSFRRGIAWQGSAGHGRLGQQPGTL